MLVLDIAPNTKIRLIKRKSMKISLATRGSNLQPRANDWPLFCFRPVVQMSRCIVRAMVEPDKNGKRCRLVTRVLFMVQLMGAEEELQPRRGDNDSAASCNQSDQRRNKIYGSTTLTGKSLGSDETSRCKPHKSRRCRNEANRLRLTTYLHAVGCRPSLVIQFS